MKKIIFWTSIFAILLTLMTSCKLSTNELAEQIKKNMASSEQFKTNNIKINSLILTKKSGNDYNGILETSEPNGKFSYAVDVTYDGDNFTWKIVTPENMPAATQSTSPQTNYEVPKLSCDYCAQQFPQYEAVNDDVRGTVFCSQNCYKSYLFQLANP